MLSMPFIIFSAQYYKYKNEMGYMYVMEHVKTVISNSGSVLFLDNTSDTSRATGINQTNFRKKNNGRLTTSLKRCNSWVKTTESFREQTDCVAKF